MNTKYKTRFSVMSYLLMAVLFTACSQEIEPSFVDTPLDMQTVRVRFNAYRAAFDSQDTDATRSGGSGTGWENGETIYLRFDDGAVKGTAVFKSASNDWEVKLDGELSRNVTGKVEAYYFDKPVSSTTDMVSMDATTGVYHATDGVYKTYANGDLDMVVTLKPITSRIRFEGSSGMEFEVSGLKYYTGYDAKNNQFTTSTVLISDTVASNGYTPYFYCEFADASRQLTVYNSEDGGEYAKSFSASVLQIRQSGHVTIPTEGDHSGWTEIQEKEFTVTGNGNTITFKMKMVKKGTFQMGLTAVEDEWQTVHSVTLTKSYYIGETEVTQGLWYAVMGQKDDDWSSFFGKGDNYPAYGMSYADCESFLTKLNQVTGQNFRFPTEAEWEFAAKGGNKSKGYTYAGSNNIGVVAWYEGNAGSSDSPDHGSHAVKTKAANELGIYDMSGNVEEWCYDWFGSYSSDAQTDPTGPTSGSAHVCRGGAWLYGSSSCICTYRWGHSDTSKYLFPIGLRLACNRY